MLTITRRSRVSATREAFTALSAGDGRRGAVLSPGLTRPPNVPYCRRLYTVCLSRGVDCPPWGSVRGSRAAPEGAAPPRATRGEACLMEQVLLLRQDNALY